MLGFLRIIIIGLLLGTSHNSVAADDNPLIAERWHSRPLVIVVPTADHPLLAGIEAALRSNNTRVEFMERKMVLYKVVAGTGSRDQQPLSASQTLALLGALGVVVNSPPTVFLIGLDGGIKLTEHSSISIKDVFALIDQMPMRRR